MDSDWTISIAFSTAYRCADYLGESLFKTFSEKNQHI